jgi:hypothetical protein
MFESVADVGEQDGKDGEANHQGGCDPYKNGYFEKGGDEYCGYANVYWDKDKSHKMTQQFDVVFALSFFGLGVKACDEHGSASEQKQHIDDDKGNHRHNPQCCYEPLHFGKIFTHEQSIDLKSHYVCNIKRLFE